jgi:type III secretory pathway component EscR
MHLRTLLMVLILGALALFTTANWTAFTTPTTLSVIFATVEAPLGLVLLGVVVALAALFLIYVVYLQSSVLFETRRHARELHAQRELSENAEVSRTHELRSFLETQLQALGQQTEQSKAELSARLDQLEGDLRQSIEQCQNSLVASIAEIDDRLEHGAAESQPRKLA